MHIFRNFKNAAAIRRELLTFLHSMDDHDLIVLIAAAAEEGTPLGFKQLELQSTMSSSTLQRRLKMLVAKKVIKKVVAKNDGRRVTYLPTKLTVEAYGLLYEKLTQNGF